jgi:hypothetical protein
VIFELVDDTMILGTGGPAPRRIEVSYTVLHALTCFTRDYMQAMALHAVTFNYNQLRRVHVITYSYILYMTLHQITYLTCNYI